MSVDLNGRSADHVPAGDGPVGDQAVDELAEPRRPSALRRVAGTIPPEGSEVDRSLEAFIAQAHSTQVDMTDWRLDEPAGRGDAERELRALARRSSQQLAQLEARLAEAEVRAMEAEKRARTGPGRANEDRAARIRTARVRPLRRRSAAAPILLAAAIVAVGVGISLLLARTSRGLGERRVNPGAPRSDGASAPEPVIRPMLPAEPAVTPLDDGAARKAAPPAKARPVPQR